MIPSEWHKWSFDRRVRGKWKTTASGCWEWTAASERLGYGVITVLGKTVRAHRYVYENVVGPIPDGLVLDHLCRNPPCVNPDHLDPVTQAENMRRGAEHWDRPRPSTAMEECTNGHPMSQENTYIKPYGGASCRECGRQAWRRWYAKKNKRVLDA